MFLSGHEARKEWPGGRGGVRGQRRGSKGVRCRRMARAQTVGSCFSLHSLVELVLLGTQQSGNPCCLVVVPKFSGPI